MERNKNNKTGGYGIGRSVSDLLEHIAAGHEEETMEQIHDRVHMEWGEAFWSQPLVNCANMLMETAEKQKFLFVPLWHTQKEGWIPKEDQNDEEGVWLFTGNPDVDQQAFMHFDDCASVPPYPSAAVCKERRQEKKRPAVIFCPGGGYEMLSYYSEGVQLAQRMERDGGYKAFIFKLSHSAQYLSAVSDGFGTGYYACTCTCTAVWN